MIFEVYVIYALSGMSLIDKTYRKIHLGVTNSLVSGLLHTIYTMFEVEMEIGFVKSIATKDYKLVYLKHEDVLVISLVDTKLEEKKVQSMIDEIGKSFMAEFKGKIRDHKSDMLYFEKFIPKLDSIVISTISDLFLENYPADIVTLVNYIGEQYSLKYQEKIGKNLAGKIRASRFSNEIKNKNLKKELSKFTVIKQLNDDLLELSVCPFCRKKKSKSPMCNFITGFVNGMLDSDKWYEKTCSGRGDKSCTFVTEA